MVLAAKRNGSNYVRRQKCCVDSSVRTTLDYPKHMSHPNYRPAVVDQPVDAGVMTRGLKGSSSGDFMPRARPTSQPDWMPPVTVMTGDEEDYYLARGYRVTNETVAAKDALSASPTPLAPDLDPREWPKYVNGVVAHNPEEEAEILGLEGSPLTVSVPEKIGIHLKLPSPDVDPAELAEFRAWKAAKERPLDKPPKRKPPRYKPRPIDPEHAALVAQLHAAGYPMVNRRFGVDRLRAMLAAATKEKANAGKEREAASILRGGTGQGEGGREDRDRDEPSSTA